MERLTLAEAAKRLGITKEAARKRVRIEVSIRPAANLAAQHVQGLMSVCADAPLPPTAACHGVQVPKALTIQENADYTYHAGTQEPFHKVT